MEPNFHGAEGLLIRSRRRAIEDSWRRAMTFLLTRMSVTPSGGKSDRFRGRVGSFAGRQPCTTKSTVFA